MEPLLSYLRSALAKRIFDLQSALLIPLLSARVTRSSSILNWGSSGAIWPHEASISSDLSKRPMRSFTLTKN